MTTQIVCDRCGKIGKFAYISYSEITGWHMFPQHKDICKDCFKYLFPEWKI